MVRMVQSERCVRIVCCMSASVSTSTAAVASSSTRMRELRNSARARHINWRCPLERFAPPSLSSASSPTPRDSRFRPGGYGSLDSRTPDAQTPFAPSPFPVHSFSNCVENTSRRCTCSIAFQRSESLLEFVGSRLKRTVPCLNSNK